MPEPAAEMTDVDRQSFSAMVPGSGSVGSLLWYLLGRAFMVTLFLGGTVIAGGIYPIATLPHPDVRLVSLLAITFLQICFSLFWLLRWLQHLRVFVQLQLVWDLVLSTLTVYITGGLVSQFPFLFIFVIFSCALVASRAEVYATVAASIILYGGLVDLQYYGYLAISPIPEIISDSEVFYRLFLNVAAFLLAGLIGSILASRLRQSAQLLAQERLDYAELEHLNRLILQHTPSGLLVVNSSGSIRSLNAAAAQICGIAPLHGRNLPLAKVFPELALASLQLPVERGELNYTNARNEKRIIGYSATAIADDHSGELGTLISFQDLTEVKRLEYQAQLGERLAALGTLAAGLAHEIRNPLASLSGSVQLLAEHQTFSAAEQHLLTIIEKESARLNRLLSDFLVFARPRIPEFYACDLGLVIREVVALAQADPLFQGVEIQIGNHDTFKATIDCGQMHQALWNLLLNAAHFSRPPKKVIVGYCPQQRCFWVDDNGPGVANELKKQIFEPFYSSRAEGTGLGLSIVHSIIGAHHGQIECLSSDWGGARFQVCLPDQPALAAAGSRSSTTAQ